MSSVVLYGPPLAGKSTILESLAQRELLKAESFEIRPHGQAFPERGYRVSDQGAVLAMTIPGAVWTMATWDQLLNEGVQILLVMDPQTSRQTVNREYADYLGERRARVAGIHITKIDIVGAERAEQTAVEIARTYALEVPATYGSVHDISSICALIRKLTRQP
jgi:GTPase SAR1 family protein